MPRKGYKQTEEHKLKNSGKNHTLYGKKRSIKVIEKIKQNNLGQKRTQETKDNISRTHADFSGKNNPMYGKDRAGNKNPNWKSDNYQDKYGRWIIWIDGIKYAQARYIAEQCLHRKLTSTEIVHHINGNCADDRPENLYVFEKQGMHTAQHHLKNPPILISNLINDK